MKYHVYAIGNALVDMEYTVDDHFLKSNGLDKGVMTLVNANEQNDTIRKLHAHPVQRSCGGSAANTIIALQQFGGQGYFACKVCNDEPGLFFLSELNKTGTHTNPHPEHTNTEAPTGKCLVLITEDAERTMHTFLGISEHISPNEVSEEAIKASEYVYLEGYLASSASGRDAIIHTHALARANNCHTAMTFSDPNMVKFFRNSLNDMLGEQVDLLFCNEKEALIWANSSELQLAVEAIKARAKTFVITLGAQGALIYDGKRCATLPGRPVQAKDTLGAGDMFAGAFLYAITHGHDYLSAGTLAIHASSELVTSFGARLSQEKQQRILNAWHAEQQECRNSSDLNVS